MKKSFAQILQEQSDDSLSRVLTKVPEWDVKGIHIPDRIATEQCSTSATAAYKAKLVVDALGRRPGCIADLTGGLGVDSWAFSKVADRVCYNEIKSERASAAEGNFAALGATNISVSNWDAETFLAQTEERFDAIFMDPGRRDAAGKKVFLVEDCQPDVLAMLPQIFEATPLLILKLSPMADITMLARRFGKRLHEIHVLSLKGEVKELLLVVRKEESEGELKIVATNTVSSLVFNPSEEADSSPEFVSRENLSGTILFEPDSAISKAGAFNILSSRFGLEKFSRFTHLYLMENDCRDAEIFGKKYLVEEQFEFGKEGFRSCAEKYPGADVSARNLPLGSDALKAKIYPSKKASKGSNPQDQRHIFGTTLSLDRKVLLVCKRIN